MPQIKSAKKRVLITEKKTAANKAMKSKISTYAKKFKAAVAEKNVAAAEACYSEVVSVLDTAVKDNVIHANNANRKKAHYGKMLSGLKSAQ